MHAPQDGSKLWTTLWHLIHWLRWIFGRIEVEGQEHVPAKGGYILACNHTMGPDFIVLGYATPRQIYYMAKAEAFEIHPIVSKIMYSAGVFPVHRGQKDIGAINAAVQVVQNGHLLGMFPEGTRSQTGELGRGRSGAARIAMQADALVIPAVVLGTEKILPQVWKPVRRPRIIARFGPPIKIEGDADDTAAVRMATQQVMVAMAALLPPNLRGEYGEGLENKL